MAGSDDGVKLVVAEGSGSEFLDENMQNIQLEGCLSDVDALGLGGGAGCKAVVEERRVAILSGDIDIAVARGEVLQTVSMKEVRCRRDRSEFTQ